MAISELARPPLADSGDDGSQAFAISQNRIATGRSLGEIGRAFTLNNADVPVGSVGSWSPCSGRATDLSGDGVVDGADLGTPLSLWRT